VLAALEEGNTRANSWFDRVQVYEFTPQMVLKADPRGGAFVNVNTPDQLFAIENRILHGKMTKLSDSPHIS